MLTGANYFADYTHKNDFYFRRNNIDLQLLQEVKIYPQVSRNNETILLFQNPHISQFRSDCKKQGITQVCPRSQADNIFQFVFNFLMTGGHLYATKYFTFDDLSKGLPSLILSCEMALIAPFFLHAYSYAPYILSRPASLSGGRLEYQGGTFGISAILSALNIVDIVSALLTGVRAKATPRRNVEMGGQNRRRS